MISEIVAADSCRPTAAGDDRQLCYIRFERASTSFGAPVDESAKKFRRGSIRPAKSLEDPLRSAPQAEASVSSSSASGQPFSGYELR